MTYDFLRTNGPPWILRSRDISAYKKVEGSLIGDGSKMKTLDSFYAEISKNLEFPTHFGRNFNALYDMLTDMTWLQRDIYVLLVDNGRQTLSGEPLSALEGFLDCLNSVSETWSRAISIGADWDRAEVPFHTLFQFAEGGGHLPDSQFYR